MTSSVPDPLARCTALLGDFIGFQTVNPGGDELALCARLADELRARDADEVIVGEVPRDGREAGGYVFARYGSPKTIINVHVDTVPVNTGWTRDPFRATIEDGRLYGLGSADTKGAIAAALIALEGERPRDLGLLFSGDEENGTEVMRGFLRAGHAEGIERAIVCEPTARKAGVRHRGFRSYRASLSGEGGHSSKADHRPKPIVGMARLALALDELGRGYLEQGPADMRGLCMNVASIEGGVAVNVIPNSATLSFSVRPPPGFDTQAFERELHSRARALDPELELEPEIAAEPFACRATEAFAPLLGNYPEAMVPLDFWTEAALWSAAGVDAVVIGPGDIAQAHAPDEFVTLADLSWAIGLFGHIVAHARSER